LREHQRGAALGTEADAAIGVQDIGVRGQESTGVHGVLNNGLVSPGWHFRHVDAASPRAGSLVVAACLAAISGHSSDVGVVGSHHREGVADGVGASKVGGGVDYAKHALFAVSRGTAVVEGRVGVVDDLAESEALILLARSEGGGGSLVAREELRRLGDGVLVGAPHELDCIADGSVNGEGNIPEGALSGSNDNGVCDTISTTATSGAPTCRRGSIRSRGGTVGSHAF